MNKYNFVPKIPKGGFLTAYSMNSGGTVATPFFDNSVKQGNMVKINDFLSGKILTLGAPYKYLDKEGGEPTYYSAGVGYAPKRWVPNNSLLRIPKVCLISSTAYPEGNQFDDVITGHPEFIGEFLPVSTAANLYNVAAPPEIPAEIWWDLLQLDLWRFTLGIPEYANDTGAFCTNFLMIAVVNTSEGSFDPSIYVPKETILEKISWAYPQFPSFKAIIYIDREAVDRSLGGRDWDYMPYYLSGFDYFSDFNVINGGEASTTDTLDVFLPEIKDFFGFK